MGGDKLWIEFSGRPAWRWGLDALLAVPKPVRRVVVAPADAIERFTAAIPEASRGTMQGGCRRRGAGRFRARRHRRPDCRRLPGGGVVLIHDAARPGASTELMERVVDAVTPTTGAIPVVDAA